MEKGDIIQIRPEAHGRAPKAGQIGVPYIILGRHPQDGSVKYSYFVESLEYSTDKRITKLWFHEDILMPYTPPMNIIREPYDIIPELEGD